jgi:hypothetical protein
MKSVTKTTSNVNLLTIPETMSNTRQWVLWKYEERKNKSTKVPYNPRTGQRAESNNESTWETLDEVIKALQKGRYSGIGFMFGAGFAGVDLDQCRDNETGEIEEWAMEIVIELASYTEISPSGTGLHIFIKGKLPGTGLNKRNWNGHKLEIYDTGRFFTFTGDHLEGTPLEVNERQAEIESLYKRAAQSTVKKAKVPAKRTRPTLSDSDVMDNALNARNRTKFEQLWDGDTSTHRSPSEADFALVKILCFWTQDDEQVARLWRASHLFREKLGRDDYIARTIAKARTLQTESYTPSSRSNRKVKGHFEVTDSEVECDADDQPISKDPKREDYLRRVLANSSRMTNARMMMVVALGFERISWRLLNALHAHQRNHLGVKIICDEKLQKLYQSRGERSASERTIRRDKEKLWEAQKNTGVEIVSYKAGTQNLATGQNFASRYVVHLDRWALEAIDMAITNNGNNYSISDEQLRTACEKIASKKRPREEGAQETQTSRKEKDAHTLEVDVQESLKRLVPRFNKVWDELSLTKGEKQIRITNLLRDFASLLLKDNSDRKDNKKRIKAIVKKALSEPAA